MSFALRNRRKKTEGRSPKNFRRILIAVGLFLNVSLLLSFFFGEMGLLNAMKLRKVHAGIQSEISWLQGENEKLLGQVDALQHDLGTIERFARDRLGLIKEGELVYEFINME